MRRVEACNKLFDAVDCFSVVAVPFVQVTETFERLVGLRPENILIRIRGSDLQQESVVALTAKMQPPVLKSLIKGGYYWAQYSIRHQLESLTRSAFRPIHNTKNNMERYPHRHMLCLRSGIHGNGTDGKKSRNVYVYV